MSTQQQGHLGLTAESFVHCLADHDHEAAKDRTHARRILAHDATGKVDARDCCWIAEMAIRTLDEAVFDDDDVLTGAISVLRPPLAAAFDVPSREELLACRVGDQVKLIFDDGAEGLTPERMWVTLTNVDDIERWSGTLSDQRMCLGSFQPGNAFDFHPYDVIDIGASDDTEDGPTPRPAGVRRCLRPGDDVTRAPTARPECLTAQPCTTGERSGG